MTDLEERIGYRFRSPELLTQALTHPSISTQPNNQRLEFLGDSVLGLIVTRILYDTYSKEQEGELARRRAALVCGPTLSQVARDIDLGEVLKLGTSEKQSQGRENASNLEDAMEALIGAIYLDGGLEAAERFVRSHWEALAKEVHTPPKDAKTALQEWAQARGLPIPAYRLIQQSGPAHAPEFFVEVTVQSQHPVQAGATTKRAAEQLAAGILLKKLGG